METVLTPRVSRKLCAYATALVLAVAPYGARAQSTTEINVIGTITIQQNAVGAEAAGATVSLYRGDFSTSASNPTEAGLIEQTAADEDGHYVMAGLLLDSAAAYTLEARDRSGLFFVRKRLELTMTPPIVADLPMKRFVDAQHAADDFTFAARKIYFVTQRARDPNPKKIFQNERSQPWKSTYAAASVSLLFNDQGCRALARPRPWSCHVSHTTSDPKVSDVQPPQSRDAFLAAVTADVAKSQSKRALLFIHGFNVGFYDALTVVGELSLAERPFDGPVILFSWPSKHEMPLYGADLTNADLASDELRQLIDGLVATVGPGKIDVVAHSMGNRVLFNALRSLALARQASAQPPFVAPLRQVIMAAADVDAETFRQMAGTLRQYSAGFTLYLSSHDQALLASRCFNGDYERLGTWIPSTKLIDGMQFVNASSAKTDFLGHGYFIGSSDVTSDVVAVLNGTARTATKEGAFFKVGSTSPNLLQLGAATLQTKTCDAVYAILKAAFDR